MFLESLIESAVRQEPRRRWTTLVSFTIQTAGIGALVLAPLIHTGALPPLRLHEPLPPPVAAPRRPEPARPIVDLVAVPPDVAGSQLVEPRVIPANVYQPRTPETPVQPPGAGECSFCVPGGLPMADTASAGNRTIAELIRPRPLPVITHAVPPRPTLVSSGVIAGLLVRRVEPEYPALAKTTRVQGTVQLTAVISKDGRVEQLQVVSGPPLLMKAALDAVRQWRYRPYLLNGAPVEVEAEITVNFRLGS